MDDFPGFLARDFGFRPQGKNAPMSSAKTPPAAAFGGGPVSGSGRSSSAAWSRSGDSVLGGGVFEDRSPPGYDDVFGGPPKYSNSSSHVPAAHSSSSPTSLDSIFDEFKDPPKYSNSSWRVLAAHSSSSPTSLDSIFNEFKDPPKYSNSSSHVPAAHSSSSRTALDSIFDELKDPPAKSSSMPVYDKPVYDDDIFDGVPGVKNTSSSLFDGVFPSVTSAPFDDLLEKLGKTMPEAKGSGKGYREQKERDLSAFDELIPGFGGSSASLRREPLEARQQSAASSAKATSEDPFVVLETTPTSTYQSTGAFTDPLEHISGSVNSESSKVDTAPLSGGVLDDLNAYDELTSSAPFFTSNVNSKSKDKTRPMADEEPPKRSSMDYSENSLPEMPPTKSSDSSKTVSSGGHNSDRSFNTSERNTMEDQTAKSYEHLETADDAWLTIAEIPLFTQPTTAPPPSRPPPPVAIKQALFEKRDQFSPVDLNTRKKDNNPFLPNSQSDWKNSVKRPTSFPADEFDSFDMGRPQRYANDQAEALTGEDVETNLAAAAMKEAMDKAELKFKQAREVREREHDARSVKSREFPQERDEKPIPDPQDLEEEKQDKLDREREQRGREERRRREREREQELERERERERERARQAVERATREARERAAAEACLKAERAAVGKANAEARQRAAERAAFQRAANEARERAAVDAREKAAQEASASEEAREKSSASAAAAAAEAQRKAAAEAQEKAAAETREKATLDAQRRIERIAVERATKEARERAAAEAQRRAAAVATAAREKQQKAENDLESFFNMGARPNSAPKQRTPDMENVVHPQSRGNSDAVRRTSSSSSSIRKAQSTTNLVDDLASVFGAPSSPEVFQGIQGETEERRRARLERHQRTLDRTNKALAEKNERDVQAQREQAERHRIAETLDVEIKRWAAGKEGNLRALLSTLQYVLWPECGWQPVSLTDLIIGASVKKVYRKATLCIHPDKVQQKGATLQQKYIAEKVFDLLKEAWNKFNSEELF